MFLWVSLRHNSIVENQRRISVFFIFRLNITSWACLVASGLKIIFHWKAHSLIFFNSSVFTCHYSKTVWLAENLNEIKITNYEKVFSHIKQILSHFEKGLRNMLTKKTFFYLTEVTIVFTEVHRIKTKLNIITKISNYLT